VGWERRDLFVGNLDSYEMSWDTAVVRQTTAAAEPFAVAAGRDSHAEECSAADWSRDPCQTTRADSSGGGKPG
jgi:hypothetical protein